MTDNKEDVNNQPAGFELIVGPPDGVIDNADVPVRWCVTPDIVAEMEREGIKNPHVVLETSNVRGDRAWRTVVPLGDMLAYARFYQAGTMQVFAAIVDCDRSSCGPEFFMERDYSEFTWRLQQRGVLYKTNEHTDVYASTNAEVVIPDGVFGKEPTGWVKWYANLWHGGNKADDQCEFRRRMILAFTLKWIPVAAWSILYVMGSLVALALTFGAGLYSWVIDWKVAFRPFVGGWTYMIDPYEGEYGDIRDSRFIPWITWDKERGLKQPVWFVAAFTPFVVSIVAFITFFANMDVSNLWWYEWHYDTAKAVAVIALIFGVIDISSGLLYFGDTRTPNTFASGPGDHFKYVAGGCVIAIFAAVTVFASMMIASLMWSIIAIVMIIAVIRHPKFIRLVGLPDSVKAWFERATEPNDYTEIRELLCPKDHENLSADINAIPKERRTWRLRYHAAKQKVCRPMQRT